MVGGQESLLFDKTKCCQDIGYVIQTTHLGCGMNDNLGKPGSHYVNVTIRGVLFGLVGWCMAANGLPMFSTQSGISMLPA